MPSRPSPTREAQSAATSSDHMAKGRELKGRIKSVENTRKITRTMEMVATSKMKRAQDRVVGGASVRARRCADVIASLYSPELAERFPLLRQPAQLTTRRGHPAHGESRPRRRVQREPDQGSARDASPSSKREGAQVDVHVDRQEGARLLPVRRPRARDAAHRHHATARRRTNAAEIVDGLMADFVARRARRACTCVYASSSRCCARRRRRTQVLPVQPPKAKAARRRSATTSSSPDAEAILDELLPLVRAQRGVSRARRDDGGVLQRRSARR